MTDRIATVHDASAEADGYNDFEPDSLLKLAALTRDNPSASSVFLTLLAKAGDEYALVVSNATLAKLCKTTVQAVERAIADLVAERLIAVVRIGSGNAYFIQSRVEWTRDRRNSEYEHFQARILISGEDNDNLKIGQPSV